MSIGNINNFQKESGKIANPDDTKRKGSPKKEKEKESDTKKDSPKRKADEVSFVIFCAVFLADTVALILIIS